MIPNQFFEIESQPKRQQNYYFYVSLHWNNQKTNLFIIKGAYEHGVFQKSKLKTQNVMNSKQTKKLNILFTQEAEPKEQKNLKNLTHKCKGTNIYGGRKCWREWDGFW